MDFCHPQPRRGAGDLTVQLLEGGQPDPWTNRLLRLAAERKSHFLARGRTGGGSDLTAAVGGTNTHTHTPVTVWPESQSLLKKNQSGAFPPKQTLLLSSLG